MNAIKNLAGILITSLVIGTPTLAQQGSSKSKLEKDQEIVIQKKGDNAEKYTIVVDGDNVTINGKPVDQFEGKDVIIQKRDRIEGMAVPHVRALREAFGGDHFEMRSPSKGNRAMLGVVTESAEGGVRIKEITKESGAEKAGLKKDDIITKLGSATISSPGDLTKAIKEFKPNDKVDVTYKRNGKEQKITATLGEHKTKIYSHNFNHDDFHMDVPEPPMPGMENFQFNFNKKPKIGLQIQDLEEGKGVSVQDVDDESPALKAGLKEGDVITHINGKEIAGVDELRNEIKDVKEGDLLKVTYKRNGATQTADIKIPKKLKTANL